MANSVIFFGTSDFSKSVLAGLVDDPAFDVVAVVSQPDRPVGRKKVKLQTQTKQLAVAHELPVFQPEKLSGSPEMAELIALQADFLVTAAFGQFIPTKLLKSAKIAAINVHASLLPRYRGAAPINWALINGDKETGVSIMYMVKAMDAGDVIATDRLAIEASDDAGSLFAKMAVLGCNLLLKTMPKLVTGEAKGQPQDNSLATLAPKIDQQLMRINFYRQSAEQVVNLVRGLSPHPGAFFQLGDQRIKLLSAKVGDKIGQVGQLSIKNKGQFGITAADGRIVLLERLQPAGKKVMTVAAFLNGQGRTFNVGSKTNEI
ncbi:methionyl-tRNA formyltransferase [Oenococcus kitaharae]|uniref:methionyl-tRNA formyltransferase n=1 Tax=Oenococcus TaxID=46254 RepID=UPI0021E70801|nr:methionyl-tRNA formyltransferase [Oenococcus kitaharae]MCV3295597.1 methionyl-tRNA formyltransferase [Oenococcus kitaharae]